MIFISNLTKDYGNCKGIFDVTLEVQKGEVFGFLGPNGAGKTTTIRNIMGFIKPDKGTCTINNLDCFEQREIIQKDVGYIPGEIAFMDDMKGMEFIKFMGNYKGIKDLSKANELIERFELDLSGRIKKMSKGMKQKLGIVVAFMGNPKTLILDEPTSGLDPLMQNRFIELIQEETIKGKTILMSSHMFEEVERTCSKLAIIKDGKIVAVDNMESIKKAKTKKYIVTLKDEQELDKIKKENINIIVTNENQVTVVVQNNVKDFINIINKYEITDLAEEKQNLEDIFMSYYGGKSND